MSDEEWVPMEWPIEHQDIPLSEEARLRGAIDEPIRVRILSTTITGTIDPRDQPTYDAMGDGPFYRVTTDGAGYAQRLDVHDDDLEVLL